MSVFQFLGGVRGDARRVHHGLRADLRRHVLLAVHRLGVLLVHLPHHVPDVGVISLGAT